MFFFCIDFGPRNKNNINDEEKLDIDPKGEPNSTANSYDHANNIANSTISNANNSAIIKDDKTAPVLATNNSSNNVIAGDQSFRSKLANGLSVPQSAPGNVVGASGRNDNMRDIGTWSNEQISDKKQFAAANRKNLSGNQGNKKEEWDNEEEWQGDLSQTQIFTASAQKKDEPINPNDPNARFDSNFPIGHFNAEEATQKIKKAVGVSFFFIFLANYLHSFTNVMLLIFDVLDW